MFDSVVKQIDHVAFIIIDGLDESPDRNYLCDHMRSLCNGSDSRDSLKVLISSRSDHHLRQILSNVPSLTIEPQHIKTDMKIHAHAELAKITKLRAMPASVQEDLVTKLVERADGMFRWIQCQLDTFRKIRTPEALEHALQALPAGLETTYDRILYSIAEEDHEFVLRLLYWLIGSERPLVFEELAEAIALNPDKDCLDPKERLLNPEEIFELCGSLLRIEADHTITFAHYSVKEYLLSGQLAGKEPKLAKFALDAEYCRRHISMCILSYVITVGLTVQSLQQDVFDEREFPLISYIRCVTHISRFQEFEAMHLWMKRHLFASQSNPDRWLALVGSVNIPTLHASNYTIAWFVRRVLQCSLMCFLNGHLTQGTVFNREWNGVSPTSRIADLFLGLQRAYESLENASNISRYYGGVFSTVSPLCAAAAFEFEPVLRLLIANGASIDGITAPQHLGNPLLWVLRHGNKAILWTLMQSGANINIQSPHSSHSTPLILAASRSTELVQYLLEEYTVDTNLLDAFGRTIVSRVFFGQIDSSQL